MPPVYRWGYAIGCVLVLVGLLAFGGLEDDGKYIRLAGWALILLTLATDGVVAARKRRRSS